MVIALGVQNESVKPQFEAFSRGFLMVCGGPALNLFHAQELETLVRNPRPCFLPAACQGRKCIGSGGVRSRSRKGSRGGGDVPPEYRQTRVVLLQPSGLQGLAAGRICLPAA